MITASVREWFETKAWSTPTEQWPRRCVREPHCGAFMFYPYEQHGVSPRNPPLQPHKLSPVPLTCFGAGTTRPPVPFWLWWGWRAVHPWEARARPYDFSCPMLLATPYFPIQLRRCLLLALFCWPACSQGSACSGCCHSPSSPGQAQRARAGSLLASHAPATGSLMLRHCRPPHIPSSTLQPLHAPMGRGRKRRLDNGPLPLAVGAPAAAFGSCVLGSMMPRWCCCVMIVIEASTRGALVCAGAARCLVPGAARAVPAQPRPPPATRVTALGPMVLALRP
jgi:hypothetical protein